jgi:hypothetical protein
MTPDLNSAEMAAIAAALKEAIERDRFPLSPRVQQLRSILRFAPYPPPKPSARPSFMLAKGRRR